MRILHVLDAWNLGGIPEQALLMAKHSGHVVHTWGYAGTATPYLEQAGIKHWEGGPPEGEHYDFVIEHTVGGWSGLDLSKWAHSRGSKIIEVMHSVASSITPPGCLDGFVAVSDLALNRNLHFPNATRIYPMADLSKFVISHGDKIGRLSRLADEKRPQDFVDIAGAFRDQMFVMAGDGPLFRQCQEAAPMNLEMTGWIRDFPEFYSRLKLFVFPTRDECACVSVAMAQGAGLPCIVQDLPALRETTGGHVTFASNISEFCDQVRHFLNTPSDFDDIAQASRGWALGQFDISVTTPAWNSYFEGLMEG